MGEEGTIKIGAFENCDPEYFIKFGENDFEQLIGLPYEIWNESKGKFEEDPNSPFFNLTEEELNYLKLHDYKL